MVSDKSGQGVVSENAEILAELTKKSNLFQLFDTTYSVSLDPFNLNDKSCYRVSETIIIFNLSTYSIGWILA